MSESYTEVPEQSEQLDQLEPDRSLDDRNVDDTLDEGYSPPERPSVLMRGRDEEETLDERLSEEEPEVWDTPISDDFVDDGEVGDERSGRLVDPNQGIGADVDQEMVAQDVGIDGAAASAEEAAMHVVDENE